MGFADDIAPRTLRAFAPSREKMRGSCAPAAGPAEVLAPRTLRVFAPSRERMRGPCAPAAGPTEVLTRRREDAKALWANLRVCGHGRIQ